MNFTLKIKDINTLCSSCDNCRMATSRKGNTYIYCDEFVKLINEEIVECSAYVCIGSMSKWEMEQAAYIIDSEELYRVKLGFGGKNKSIFKEPKIFKDDDE